MNDLLDLGLGTANLSDPELGDTELMTEIRLVGELMVASHESDGRLEPALVDRILGIEEPSRGAVSVNASDGR
jgi:hypothetical protein